jgi:hypothetical protein
MPLPIVGQVTNTQLPAAAGSTTTAARQSLDGGLVVYEGGGKWQEACARATKFTGFSAAAGVNIPQYSSTIQLFTLLNPAGNTVAGVLKSWIGGFVGGPTPVAGMTMISGLNYSALGQAAPVVTSSNTVINDETQITGGNKISCLSSCTVTAANWWRPSGITVWTVTAGNTPIANFGEEFDGGIILKPGSWLAICSNVATFGTAILSASWLEIPLALVN